MKYAWDVMINVSCMESEAIKLRKLACDGSMIHGHTINQEKCVANAAEIRASLYRMQEQLARAVDLARA